MGRILAKENIKWVSSREITPDTMRYKEYGEDTRYILNEPFPVADITTPVCLSYCDVNHLIKYPSDYVGYTRYTFKKFITLYGKISTNPNN